VEWHACYAKPIYDADDKDCYYDRKVAFEEFNQSKAFRLTEVFGSMVDY
jgi:hypothetical protein